MKVSRLLVLAAMLAAFVVYTLPASADCPPDNPNCHLTPPQSVEVNSNPLSADGSPVDVSVPGALSGVNFTVPMPLPRQVEAVPLAPQAESAPPFPTLPVPLRQDPSAIGCSVQALGMALDGAGGSAPTSAALQGYLQENGMVGPNGAGLEDLAATARAFGYEGSTAFQDWTLDQLAGEVGQGRPVVASLAADGADRCVTVTGASPDRQWVAYNDPSQGRQVVASDTFAGQWAAQGNSGIAVGLQAAPAAAASRPAGTATAGQALAMAGLAAAAVATTAPLVRRRKDVWGETLRDRRLPRGEEKEVRGEGHWLREAGPGNASAPFARQAATVRPKPTPLRPIPVLDLPAWPFRALGNLGKIAREEAKSHFLTRPIGAGATKLVQFPAAAGVAIGELREAARPVWERAGEVAGGAIKSARDAVSRIVRLPGQIRTVVGQGIRNAADSVGNALGRVWEAGVDTVRGIRRRQWPSLRATAEGVSEAFEDLKYKAASSMGRAWAGVKSARSRLGWMIVDAKDKLSDGWDGVKAAGNRFGRMIGRAADKLSDGWDGVRRGFSRLGPDLKEWKGRVVSGFRNGVSAAFEKAGGVLNYKLRPAVSFLTSGRLGDEIAARGGMSWILRDAWDGIKSRAKQAGASLLAPNSESFNGKVSAVGGAGAIVSLVGNLGFGITGNKNWNDVAGTGTVITGAADLVGFRNTLATAYNALTKAAEISRPVSGLMKISGGLSAVAGLYTLASEGSKAWVDYQTNGRVTEKGGIAIANAASGLLATAGGIMLFTPIAPLGGVLLAASSIVSAGTWVYENRERIGNFIGNGLAALPGAAANVRTAADMVVRQVAQSVSTTAKQVAGSVGNFFGKLLGTGSGSPPAPATPTPARSSQLPPRPTPTSSPAPVRTQVASSYTAPASQPAARPVATAQPPRPQPTPRATAQARTPSRPSTGSRGRR